MHVSKSSRVGAIVHQFPEAEDVFGWHGVVLDDDRGHLTLEQLCRSMDLDLHDVLEELRDAAVAGLDEDDDGEDDEDGWYRDEDRDLWDY